ncbi:cytochrome c [uncultured Tateyamaria sp.]|uniref:c-type cytochrome n=1 Tax=uncultured Tateyamaria sp. TaxID=455651 RepID=UPI0026137B87|nr:cytochrome c [uncultured Tateyamaria sp.]
MRRAIWTAGASVVVLTVAFYSLGAVSAEMDRVVLRDTDPKVITTGAAVYDESCASCHGTELEGQANWRIPEADGRLPAPPHDETGHTWHHDGDTLFRLTKYGVGALINDPDYASNMPIYEGVLTDDEIIAVLSYIKSTWPEDIRSRHTAMENRK